MEMETLRGGKNSRMKRDQCIRRWHWEFTQNSENTKKQKHIKEMNQK